MYNVKQLIGDHLLIVTEIDGVLDTPKMVKKRNWKNYIKPNYCANYLMLSLIYIPITPN